MTKEEEILKFTACMEMKVRELQYGTMTVNIMLNNGAPIISSMHVVKQKRRRYFLNKAVVDNTAD